MARAGSRTPRRVSGILSLLIVLAIVPAPSGAISGGEPGNEEGLFVVEDALGQFLALKHHAEALAWRDEPMGPDSSDANHYQGVVRNPRPGDAPVFYVSQKDGEGGYLHVVEFGSRTKTGERLRSNVQARGEDPPPSDGHHTVLTIPLEGDAWAKLPGDTGGSSRTRFDGKSVVFDGVTLPAYVHPGGMAVVDDVLFVPVDTPVSAGSVGQLLLFDVSDPKVLVPLQALDLEHGIDNVAVTRLSDGAYLIWTNGAGGSAINIYRTTHNDLRDDALRLSELRQWSAFTDLVWPGCPFEEVWLCWPGLTFTFPVPASAQAHQSSTFLRDTDGQLYLIGMRHPGGSPSVGEDFADLFSVDVEATGRVVLTRLSTRRFHCVYDGGLGSGLVNKMRLCNMGAGNTAYVSPTGELILYSIPHHDDGRPTPSVVRMGEFRHRDVNREGSPLRSPTAEANGPYPVDEGDEVSLRGVGAPPRDGPWVELYDDDGFEDRSIVVDYDDKEKFELFDFEELDGFGDKTSSIRWRSPVGLDIHLFEDDHFTGRVEILSGTGTTQSIENFRLFGVSSMRWVRVGSPPAFDPPTLEWDLDGDSVFGETGADALRGDETGASPTFNAAALDGPSDVVVTLQVSVPNVTAVGTDTAVVHVQNVPPTASIQALTDEAGAEVGSDVPVALAGLRLDGVFGYADPGVLDTHTAIVDWGDGVATDLGVVTGGAAAASHVYEAPGEFTITWTVTDDDGGEGQSTRIVRVVDGAGAIGSAVDMLHSIPGAPFVDRALDKLQGGDSGDAENGASDLLVKGNDNAALGKISQAVRVLKKAESEDPTLDLVHVKGLLTLAAKAVAIDVVSLAESAASKPNEVRKAAKGRDLIAQGDTRLAAADYAAAVDLYQFAVRTVQ